MFEIWQRRAAPRRRGDLVASYSARQAISEGQGRRERVRPKGQEIRLQRVDDAKYEGPETKGILPVDRAELSRREFSGDFSPSAPRYGHFHAGLASGGRPILVRWAAAAFQWCFFQLSRAYRGRWRRRQDTSIQRWASGCGRDGKGPRWGRYRGRAPGTTAIHNTKH